MSPRSAGSARLRNRSLDAGGLAGCVPAGACARSRGATAQAADDAVLEREPAFRRRMIARIETADSAKPAIVDLRFAELFGELQANRISGPAQPGWRVRP